MNIWRLASQWNKLLFATVLSPLPLLLLDDIVIYCSKYQLVENRMIQRIIFLLVMCFIPLYSATIIIINYSELCTTQRIRYTITVVVISFTGSPLKPRSNCRILHGKRPKDHRRCLCLRFLCFIPGLNVLISPDKGRGEKILNKALGSFVLLSTLLNPGFPYNCLNNLK